MWCLLAHSRQLNYSFHGEAEKASVGEAATVWQLCWHTMKQSAQHWDKQRQLGVKAPQHTNIISAFEKHSPAYPSLYNSALGIPDCISTSPTKVDSCVFLQHVHLLWQSEPEIKLLQRFTSFSVLSSSFYPQQSTASSKKLLCETRAFSFLRCLSLHALTTNAVRQTRRETAGHTARPLVLTANAHSPWTLQFSPPVVGEVEGEGGWLSKTLA